MNWELQILELDASVIGLRLHQMAQRNGGTPMELQEQFSTMIEIRNLEHVGFSSQQIARLFIIKALYQGGAYQEATPEYKRLAFVRWLYEQGRLQS